MSPYKFLPRSPASKSSSPDADAGSERDSSSSPEESLVPYGGAHGYQPYPPSGQDESESAGSAYYASDEQYLSSIDYETDEYDPHRNRLEYVLIERFGSCTDFNSDCEFPFSHSQGLLWRTV